jgi:hypothetical protein
MQRRHLLTAAAGSAAAVALPRFAWAQGAYRAEYKMSTVVPPAFAWGKGGEIFGNLVRERTSGRINIKQYPGASLVQGQQDREFSAMRQGVIDVLCGAPINWSGTVRELSVFTLPFLLPDHKAYDAVIGNTALMTEYFDMVRKAGAEPLAVGETGYRQVSNSKRPDPQARRPEGHQDPRGGQPDVRRDHEQHGRQPHLHELGRRATRDGVRRGRRPGEPARGVPGRQGPHAGAEVAMKKSPASRAFLFLLLYSSCVDLFNLSVHQWDKILLRKSLVRAWRFSRMVEKTRLLSNLPGFCRPRP